MSHTNKIRSLTNNVCMVCDEQGEIILHKTRRQVHMLCYGCFISYIEPYISTALEKLKRNIRVKCTIPCPGTYKSVLRNHCKHEIDITSLDIQNIPDQVQICTFVKIQIVLSNNRMYMCPTCTNVIEADNNVKEGFCDKCQTRWCLSCYVSPYHERRSCIQHAVENKTTEQDAELWELCKQGIVKFCPRCKTPIGKNEGCNKMTCKICNTKWCWLCQKFDIDYDHFSKGRCNQKLFAKINTPDRLVKNKS